MMFSCLKCFCVSDEDKLLLNGHWKKKESLETYFPHAGLKKSTDVNPNLPADAVNNQNPTDVLNFL